MSAPGPPIGWNLDGPSGGGPSKSKKKSKDKKKRREKRKSSSSSDSSSSSSSSDERHKKGNKFSKLREGVSVGGGKVKKLKKHKKDKRDKKRDATPDDFMVPINLMQNRVTAPETHESWQARQNILRRVVDPSTGRERLIRGDGEILEEIVSRGRHQDINRQATAGDGQFFQSNTVGSAGVGGGWNVPKQQ